MFADTVLAAERLHLIRLLAWGALSVIAGTALLAFTSRSRARPQLLSSFAAQCTLWGGAELVLAGWAFSTLTMRDLSGAARLERLGWMQIGLYAGVAGCGLVLALTGWRAARSLRVTGAGLGVFLQGVALLVFELFFVSQISR